MSNITLRALCSPNSFRDRYVIFSENLLTLPISEVHDTTIVLGTVVDSRTSDVMLMGRLGLFGSTPFLVGGRYPCRKSRKDIRNDSRLTVSSDNWGTVTVTNINVKMLKWICSEFTDDITAKTKLFGLTGRLQGLPFTFTHRLGGKWSSWGQLVSDKQNLKRNYIDDKLKSEGQMTVAICYW